MYNNGRLLENMLIVNLLFASVDWNPKIVAKYRMVDLDTEETSSLKNMFPHIRVFLCNFHREQSLHRHYISYLLYLLIPKNSLLFKQNKSLKCKGCLQEISFGAK